MKAIIDIRPLRTSPAFRRLWIGTSASALGGQLTVVAVLAQVWELSRNPLAVGSIGLAHAVPMVVFGVIGGALADVVDRRRLVLLTTIGQLVSAFLLAAQAISGLASLPVVLALVAVQATCMGLGAPARRTFVSRLLPGELVGAGIALSHVSFQAAMLIGPAIAGIVTARWGVGTCYVLDALTFAAGFYGVFRLPAMRPMPDDSDGAASSRSGPGVRAGLHAIWDGWRFIARHPVVRGAFLTDTLATVLAMPVALFPAINAERFGDRPETLGLFLSAIAVGGICAGALSGITTRARRPGAVMLGSAIVWGVGLAGVGLAPNVWIAFGCLAIAGAADTVSVISRGTIVQLATPDSHRGRVSAVEHIIGVSGPDVGNFRGGAVAGITSAPFALISGGLVSAAGIGLLALTNRSLRDFDTLDRQPAAVDAS